MTLTEAYELVLKVATATATYEAVRGDPNPKLIKAIHKVSHRVSRMRQRLDASRARKAGKPTCPKWAMP